MCNEICDEYESERLVLYDRYSQKKYLNILHPDKQIRSNIKLLFFNYHYIILFFEKLRKREFVKNKFQ